MGIDDVVIENRRQFLQRQFASEFKSLCLRAAKGSKGPPWNSGYTTYLRRVSYRRVMGRHLMAGLAFEQIGQGCFSDVFSHYLVPGFVVKVSWYEGDMGRAWAKWCSDNAELPYLPRIIDPSMHGNVWTCWMPCYDKLEQFDDSVVEEAYHFANNMLGPFYEAETAPDYDEVEAVAPGLFDVCSMVREAFENYGTFDLHSDNAMWDPYRECIVLTDPLSFSEEDEDGTQ